MHLFMFESNHNFFQRPVLAVGIHAQRHGSAGAKRGYQVVRRDPGRYHFPHGNGLIGDKAMAVGDDFAPISVRPVLTTTWLSGMTAGGCPPGASPDISEPMRPTPCPRRGSPHGVTTNGRRHPGKRSSWDAARPEQTGRVVDTDNLVQRRMEYQQRPGGAAREFSSIRGRSRSSRNCLVILNSRPARVTRASPRS